MYVCYYLKPSNIQENLYRKHQSGPGYWEQIILITASFHFHNVFVNSESSKTKNKSARFKFQLTAAGADAVMSLEIQLYYSAAKCRATIFSVDRSISKIIWLVR